MKRTRQQRGIDSDSKIITMPGMELRSRKKLVVVKKTRIKKIPPVSLSEGEGGVTIDVSFTDVSQTPSSQSDEFVSCLSKIEDVASPCSTHLTHLLKGVASSEGEINDTSWLSSHMIDLVISQFAKWYRDVDFLSIDFVLLALNSSTEDNFGSATDILGRKLKYDPKRPIVLLCNSGNIHWTLIRVNFKPTPELQLFEPMGKPANRTGQLSFRYVPRNIIRWLDTCCPLRDGRTWLAVTTSAITSRHQFTSFDCGVACLLYAEKCGLGQDKDTINESTSQEDITSYRRYLQEFLKRMRIHTPPPSCSSSSSPLPTDPPDPAVPALSLPGEVFFSSVPPDQL